MHPASNLLVEQCSYGDVPFSTLVVIHLKVSTASKGLGKQFQVLHAVESKKAHSLTHMTVGSEVPGIRNVHETIGDGLARALPIPTVFCMPAAITKAPTSSLDNRPPHLLH